MKKIVVIGSVNQDISLSMRKLPIEGDTVIAESIKYNGGGKGANQAVALSRMGSKTIFVCSVGDDDNGKKLIDDLVNDGVEAHPIVKKGVSTGFAIISVDSYAKNSIVVYPGANYAMSPNDLENILKILKGATYCVMQLELQLCVIKEVLALCKQESIPVVLNPAPYHPEFDLHDLKDVAYFIPNQNEFYSLFEDKPEHLEIDEIVTRARTLCIEYGVKIIVTLGTTGSIYIDTDTEHFVPALLVNAVDTTAAGDTYIGAFVSRIANGETVLEAMKFATKASSITVSTKGAQESIPYLDQIV